MVRTRVFIFLSYTLLSMLQSRRKEEGKHTRAWGTKNFNKKKGKQSKNRRRNYMLRRVMISSETVRENMQNSRQDGKDLKGLLILLQLSSNVYLSLRSLMVKKNPSVVLREKKSQESTGCIVFLVLISQIQNLIIFIT